MRDIPALGDGARRVLHAARPAAQGVRLGIGTNRVGVRVLDIDGIDDEQAARERGHVPCARGALDPDGPGGDRLPRRRHDDTRRQARRLSIAWSSPPPTASRSTTTSPACDAANIELVAIDLEAFALLRAVAPRCRTADGDRTAVVALCARPRPHDARDLRRQHLRLHARARVGRRASSTPRSRASSA